MTLMSTLNLDLKCVLFSKVGRCFHIVWFLGFIYKERGIVTRQSLQRVAFVKLGPKGKSYAMRCDREDLGVGDCVEVEMYANTKRAYWDDGVIVGVEYLRWNCSCHVKYHID